MAVAGAGAQEVRHFNKKNAAVRLTRNPGLAGKAALERGLPWARVGKELALTWRRPAFILP